MNSAKADGETVRSCDRGMTQNAAYGTDDAPAGREIKRRFPAAHQSRGGRSEHGRGGEALSTEPAFWHPYADMGRCGDLSS